MATKEKRGCGCFKYVLYLAALIFVVVQLVNAGIIPTPSSELPPISVNDTVCDFYYERLSPTEQHVYAELLKTARTGKLKCTISDINPDVYGDAAKRAVAALTYDHPELFWLSGGWESTGNRLSQSITIKLYAYDFWKYVYDPQKYIDTFEQKVNAVVTKAATYDSPYEQAEFVHDYVTHNTYYDYDRLEEAQKTVHAANSEYIYSAYGCLVDKAAVCAGYARAYQVIMNRLGYTCTYVRGDAGGPHAWNYVELDGDGYFVDTTWDDADWRNDSGVVRYPNDAEYDYFLITTAELTKTHTPDESLFDIPVCTDKEYNYYRYNGYYVTAYSFEKVSKILDDQADKSVLCVQFATAAEMNKAKAHLMDKGYWSKVPSLKGRKISYIVDNDHLSITILKK